MTLSGSGLQNLAFGYGADGQRIRKDVLNDGGDLKLRTYYIRDAQGNLMATYNYDGASTFSLEEPLTGASLPQKNPLPLGYAEWQCK